jgi:hypothetical protein
MQDNVPTNPSRHGMADLLRLVGAVRRLAFDRNLPAVEAIGRVRDLFAEYDEGGA